MSDPTWPKQQPQRQDSLTDQLNFLHRVAARLGMYDAADWLWKHALAASGQRDENGSPIPMVVADPAPTDPHTRTSTPHGPDFCAECSADIRQWVHWPCGGSARMAADPAPTGDTP